MNSDQLLKKSAFSGTIWKFLERFCAQGISLIVSIIIARLLSPKDYSIVSLVTIFFTFANVLISGGLNTALIQKKDSDSKDYSTILLASTVSSIFLYFVLFFIAPVIARIYGNSDIIIVMRVMGIILPVYAIKSVWCAYISAHFRFKTFFLCTIIGTVISGIIGIVMAVNGCGVWALVFQQMSNTIIDTIMLVAVTRIGVRLEFSFSRFMSLFGYGWKIMVSSFIGVLYTELSPLFIGIKYEDEDLSFYTKGKSFPAMLSSSITNTLSAVLFPVLAKCQDDKKKVLQYSRLYMRVSSYLVFPMLLGFFAISDNFVIALLTEKWLSASYYIKAYCFVAMFEIIAVGNCETIKAIGRSDVYLKIEIIKKVCYFIILGLFIAFSQTPEGLAISSIACTVVQIVVNCVPNNKLIGYKVSYFLIDLLPNLLSAILMCFVVTWVGQVLTVSPLAAMIIQVIVGVGLYIGISLLTHNKSLVYLLNTVKGFLFKRGAE